MHNRQAVTEGHEAILALGSNLGDRVSLLLYALRRLGNIRRMSQVFETKPVGGPAGQSHFYNMAVVIDTNLNPFTLMHHCLQIEKNAGRERKERCGPRTLDIDVLFFDDLCLESEELTLPHPRIFERPFVLAPLWEVAPERMPSFDAKLFNEEIRPLGDIHQLPIIGQ